MARCGCVSSSCSCIIDGSITDCITITVEGSGILGDEYIITGDLNLDPDGGLTCGVDGLAVSGGDTHDGDGAGSTFIELTANSPDANGADSVAMGSSAVADGNNSVGIGTSATTTSNDSVAIGGLAEANALNTVAVGRSSLADAIEASAFGRSSSALRSQSVAIGTSAQADAVEGVAIGSNATTFQGASPGAVSIGGDSYAENGGVSLGDTASAWSNSAALGKNTTAHHTTAVALGSGTTTTNNNQINCGTGDFIAGAPNSVTADADLANSQLTFYIDEATDTLTIKVKYSTGTVKTFLGALV